jgi:DNA-directed RNA polymerase specialized sigma24 family protein
MLGILQEPEPGREPEQSPVALSGDAAIMRETLDNMDGYFASVIQLYYLEGAPTADIAETWGFPEEQLEGRLSMAMNALRRALHGTGVTPTALLSLPSSTPEIKEDPVFQGSSVSGVV